MMAESTQDAILKEGHPTIVAPFTHTTLLFSAFQTPKIFQNVFR
jgi:hypothetical protein